MSEPQTSIRPGSTVILVQTDGTVTALDETDPYRAAKEHIGPTTTVFTCSSPPGAPDGFPTFDGPLVGFCGDNAHTETPTVNVKAWALYGRSPIAGPVVLVYDDRRKFDEAWLGKLAGNIPGLNSTAMREIAESRGLVYPG